MRSVTLITTEPNELVATIHNRMPVILPPEKRAAWLAADAAPDQLTPMLVAYPADAMTARPVSTAVNNARQDTPDCIAPAA